MFVRKNYYLYAENAEKQNEKKKLLGSVRLTRRAVDNGNPVEGRK